MQQLVTSTVGVAISLAALLACSGCEKNNSTARTVLPAEPAQRAAVSFIHCVEQEGGSCVTRDPAHGSWDAFALLNWLGAGSPTSILRALRRELDHHRDPLAVQDRFVALAARYREPLRGAECQPQSAVPITELLPKLVTRVESRMQGLGLWRTDLAQVVDGLANEAEHGLGEGWLVHMTCYGDPYEIWVATAKREDRQVVVGLLTSLPAHLGGHTPDDEVVEGRIGGRISGSSTTLGVVREGTVDTRWLPISIEEF